MFGCSFVTELAKGTFHPPSPARWGSGFGQPPSVQLSTVWSALGLPVLMVTAGPILADQSSRVTLTNLMIRMPKSDGVADNARSLRSETETIGLA
jgi:hypothetical protein